MGYVIKPNVVTVSYEELSPSPDENFAEDMLTTARIFKCAWSDRMTLVKELLGWTEIVRGNYVFHLPHKYQPEGLLGSLYCKEVGPVKGFGALVDAPVDTQVAEYNDATLVVRYESPEFSVNPDAAIPLISESIEPTSEFLTLSHENIFWDNAQARPVQGTEPPARLIHMFDWVYTIHRLPYIPPALIYLTGYVNSNTIYSRSLNMYFAPEVLLLGNPSMSREYTSLGLTMWSITVRMTARETGWNNFPEAKNVDSNGNIWWGHLYDDSGVMMHPYPLADFSNIII